MKKLFKKLLCRYFGHKESKISIIDLQKFYQKGQYFYRLNDNYHCQRCGKLIDVQTVGDWLKPKDICRILEKEVKK